MIFTQKKNLKIRSNKKDTDEDWSQSDYDGWKKMSEGYIEDQCCQKEIWS